MKKLFILTSQIEDKSLCSYDEMRELNDALEMGHLRTFNSKEDAEATIEENKWYALQVAELTTDCLEDCEPHFQTISLLSYLYS